MNWRDGKMVEAVEIVHASSWMKKTPGYLCARKPVGV